MSKSDVFENALLQLIFNGTSFSGFADNAASSPVSTLYVSLHTSDPGDNGDQTTNEANYTGYARVGVVRSSSGWCVSENSVSPIQAISFGACTGGTEVITHFAVGSSQTGAGVILYSGSVTPNISVYSGVTPSLGVSSAITED